MDQDGVSASQDKLGVTLSNIKLMHIVALLIGVIGVYFSFCQKQRPLVRNAPVHGFRSVFEPSLLLKARFISNAYEIVEAGYRKFKDIPFVVYRYDSDVVIMPIRYLNELSLVPTKKLDSKPAAVGNLAPDWTWMRFAMETTLHIRVINNKLTPDLPKYLDIARGELEFAWHEEVPQPHDWTEVDIQQTIRLLVARMTARVFVGSETARDREWLNLTIDFAADLFNAAFMLKMFPPWALPVVAHLIPARYRLKSHLTKGSRILGKAMQKCLEAKRLKQTETIGEADEEHTLLSWMMDNGTDTETMVPEMTARQFILGLASIHTTSSNITNILLDLCANPEWFPILREEISQVTRENGRLGEREGMSTTQWLAKLEKLDSFFIETQRFNPAMLVHPQRVAMEPITLSDGTHIPAGTWIAWANHHHTMDPSVTPNPTLFDPMRSYRGRHSAPDQMNKHLAGQTDPNLLSFGYGKSACPGRYYAVGEIKTILVRLLSEFDWKYPVGKGRPKNMYANENVFVDPNARLLMKKRLIDA